MKESLIRFLLLLTILLTANAIAAYAFQGGGRPDAPPPTTPPGGPKPNGPKPPPGPKPSKPSTVGQLVIHSKPGGCAVLLDGKVMGTTNGEGILTMASVKPGEHILTVRRAAHTEERRNVRVYAGQSDVQEFYLRAQPGRLTVTTSIAGAQVQIAGVGEYASPISDLGIAPGHYTITVSKPGYRRVSRDVDVRPAEASSVSVALERLSATEMLAQAEVDFRNRQYDQVIATGRTVLAAQPDQPRANFLVGMSLYNSEQYTQSVVYLGNAILGGQQVSLPIKHHHRAGLTGLEDNFCAGNLLLQKSSLEFQATDGSGHSFSVPFNKIYELRNEWQKAGRVHLKVGVSKGNKEDKKDYNMHVAAAELRTNGTVTKSFCDSPSCQPMAEALFQLLTRFKQ